MNEKEILLSLFHHNLRYVVDGGILRVMNADLSDGGLYTCIARTSLDEENATALLTVLGETGVANNIEPSVMKYDRG